MTSRFVRTLDQPSFDDACAALMRRVEASYAPTLMVGIRTGGLVVAQAMARAAVNTLAIEPLTCRRAATGAKARLSFLRALLTALPRPVTDALRLLEARLLSSRRRSAAGAQPIDRAEAVAVGGRLQTMQAPRLLVVDDALDSGKTLATVLRVLREACPAGTEIRSAAITVTLDNPVDEPDYALYRRVVCRFPWSFDAA